MFCGSVIFLVIVCVFGVVGRKIVRISGRCECGFG